LVSVTSTVIFDMSEGKRGGKGKKDFEEIVSVFNVR
jgi:hypothetical protein